MNAREGTMLQKTKYVLLGVFLSALGLWGLAVTIPNTFADGDVVSSSKMNENFQALKNAVDTLEAKLEAMNQKALVSAEGALGRALVRWDGQNATAAVDTTWSFNASGGQITVDRLSQGRYNVTFEGLAQGNKPFGTALAGSRDPAGGNCNVTTVKNEADNAPDVIVGVRCFDAAGALQDGDFRVLYIR